MTRYDVAQPKDGQRVRVRGSARRASYEARYRASAGREPAAWIDRMYGRVHLCRPADLWEPLGEGL